MLLIDGSYGEGGGQLLRTAVALAAVTGTPVAIDDIRAGRARPGLAAQHLTAVRAVGALCDAAIEGLAPGSRRLVFQPRALRGGDFAFDVGTAGSVTLVLQALLPAMLMSRQPVRVQLAGGTDVRAAPPLDYFLRVLLRLLSRMGASVAATVERRGYYPRGGGAVRVVVQPRELHPAALASPGPVRAVEGLAHVARLPLQIAERMRDAARERLAAAGLAARIECRAVAPDAAAGPGGAVVLWAGGEHSVLGAGRVAQRGVRAEALGAAVADEIAGDLAAGAALDVHAADQLPVFLALAGRTASFTARELSSHARTALWLIERFLPVRFGCDAAGGLALVTMTARRV